MVYMSGVLYDFSNTLTAFLSLERCLCISLSLKFRHIFTTKITVVVIVCTYVLCFGLMVLHFLTSGFVTRTSGNSTFLTLWLSPNRAAVDAYVDVMHFCQTTAIMSVVFVSTFVMLVSLKRSSNFQSGGIKRTASPRNFVATI
ncbi:chemosensory receptor C [Elysia marginata]|uniref:Chemosensory receptor C n=1 Tax=Elysia marginata TaxID=1093978 RepID=A0AAV4K0N2_9GAST|nr:chemosensory receptor C [Elysia marginata]